MAPNASVEDALDELYRTPPDDFVARRTVLAKELADAGDKAGAKELKAARRPTLAAWALNQLRYEAPEVVEDAVEVADLGRRMLTGDAPGDARALSQRRREVVAALTTEARGVLKAQGEASAAIERQVVETLDAALVSPDVADQLLAGRLVAATTATGFEGLLALPGGGEDSAGSGLVDRTKARPTKGKAKAGGPNLRVIDGGRSDADDEDDAAAERAARREETAEAADAAKARLDQLVAEAEVAAEELQEGNEELAAAEAEVRTAEAKALALEHRLEEARARVREAEGLNAAAQEAARAAEDED